MERTMGRVEAKVFAKKMWGVKTPKQISLALKRQGYVNSKGERVSDNTVRTLALEDNWPSRQRPPFKKRVKLERAVRSCGIDAEAQSKLSAIQVILSLDTAAHKKLEVISALI